MCWSYYSIKHFNSSGNVVKIFKIKRNQYKKLFFMWILNVVVKKNFLNRLHVIKVITVLIAKKHVYKG